MKQNDINKQFSDNNNKTWSGYVALLGSFLLIIGVFLNDYPSGWYSWQFKSGKVLFVTVLVMIVLSFLAVLSSYLGYSRRRDHVVSCASSPNDAYSRICNNGRDKCYFNYLLGAYGHFYYVFILSTLLFGVFSCFIFIKHGPVSQRWVVCICGALSFIIPLMLNCKNYCHYIKICQKAKHYEEKQIVDFPTNTSGVSIMKNISVIVNN